MWNNFKNKFWTLKLQVKWTLKKKTNIYFCCLLKRCLKERSDVKKRSIWINLTLNILVTSWIEKFCRVLVHQKLLIPLKTTLSSTERPLPRSHWTKLVKTAPGNLTQDGRLQYSGSCIPWQSWWECKMSPYING